MAARKRGVVITKRVVDAAHPDPGGDLWIWDAELAGFCLRVWPSGRKVYMLRYRAGSRQRWLKLGVHGAMTPEKARKTAKLKLLQISDDGDPQAEREELKRALTVDQLIELYLTEGPIDKPNKRTSSWGTDRLNLERHVSPLLGKHLARDLAGDDITRWQANVAQGKTAARGPGKRKQGRTRVLGGKGAAARAVCTLAAMFSWAVRRGHLSANPAVGVSKLQSGARDRFLSDDEARALRVAVDELARPRRRGLKPRGRDQREPTAEDGINPDHADAVRLLMMTGARRGEILGLRWQEVDLGRALIVLPPARHKGGRTGKPKPIALPVEGLAILAARKKAGQFVFPDATGKKPLVSIKDTWAKIIARAELPGLRLHDLRHSFASFAVADNVPLYVVGKSLGHAKSSTTERYAHLRDEPLRAAAEGVARRYAPTMAGDAANAEIVALQVKRRRKNN